MSIFRDRSVERRNFFHSRATIEQLPLDRFPGRIRAGDEEQIVHDSGEPFTFGNGGFDDFAILAGRALTC